MNKNIKLNSIAFAIGFNQCEYTPRLTNYRYKLVWYSFAEKQFCFITGIIPEFLGKVDDTQYGVEGRLSKIMLYMRAYPEPKILWYVICKRSIIDKSYCNRTFK